MPSFAISNMSISVKKFNFNSVFYKAACHANPGAETNINYQ